MHLFVAGRAPNEYHKEFQKYVNSLKIPRGISIKEVKIYEIQFDEAHEEKVMEILNFFNYGFDDPGKIDKRDGARLDLNKIHTGINIDKALKFGLRFVPFADFVDNKKFGTKWDLPYRPDGGPWWMHLIFLAKLKDPKNEKGDDIL